MDEARGARRAQLPREGHKLERGPGPPPLGQDLAVARVEAEDQPGSEPAGPAFQVVAGVDRGRADDDAGDPGVEGGLDQVGVARSATGLDRDRDGGGDPRDLLQVAPPPGLRAVEVHDMEPGGAGRRAPAGDLDRIVAEPGHPVEVALLEANGATLEQIDRGQDQHGRPVRSFIVLAC
ncbi:MAG TPA: hypothetical protein VET65_01210 [Candidatus Limnocylindrales bacterium]|nr:hypothetical protein [Candidatus Limnocylindrales bacterium]